MFTAAELRDRAPEVGTIIRRQGRRNVHRRRAAGSGSPRQLQCHQRMAGPNPMPWDKLMYRCCGTAEAVHRSCLRKGSRGRGRLRYNRGTADSRPPGCPRCERMADHRHRRRRRRVRWGSMGSRATPAHMQRSLRLLRCDRAARVLAMPAGLIELQLPGTRTAGHW
jgi:hypothetical protein